jgi:hypothetical protein
VTVRTIGGKFRRMTEITLNLSDRIVTLTDGAPRVISLPKTTTWSHAIVAPTRSEFLKSHRLLLAQSLALTGNWINQEFIRAG